MTTHHPAGSVHGSLSIDFSTIADEVRQEKAYAQEGHAARTLLREADLRIVLIVMKAGSRMKDHLAKDTASIQTISGHVTLRLPDRRVDLSPGGLLILERGLTHDVEATTDSVFLLTLGWTG